MTQDEKRVKIMGALGKHDYLGVIGLGYRCSKCNAHYQNEVHSTTDPFEDMNAANDAELALLTSDAMQETYAAELLHLLHVGATRDAQEWYALAHADPASRMNALGITLGLWKEGE